MTTNHLEGWCVDLTSGLPGRRDSLCREGELTRFTTLATYSHLWPDADDRTRTAVERLMASALQDRADLVRTSHEPQPAELRI